MLAFLAETLTAPLAAARRQAGPGVWAAPAWAAVALGAAGSTVAGWIVAGRGVPGGPAGLAQLGGRLLLDLAGWLVAAALLRAAEEAELRRVAGEGERRAGRGAGLGDGPGVTNGTGLEPGRMAAPAGLAAGSWALPVAVAAGQRVYLAPAAALARLTGLRQGWRALSTAVTLWSLAVLWLAARERGHSPGAAARLLLVGLALPTALAVAGAALAGLGWLLRPLLPGGITPFVPL